MKITCEREQILAAFQTAASVVPSRSPKTILQNVKLDVIDQAATFIATDMEIGIRINVPGIEAEVSGAAVLPVDRFGSILRESNDDKLMIESDLQGVVIRGDRSEFNLPAANPHEFPDVAEFDEEKYHEVPARLFKELVRRTLFATDTDSSRYALGGVLLEMEADKIIAVGTDGRRLAKMEGAAHSINDHLTGETMTIVPTRSMQLIERALSDSDAEIKVAARPNDLLIRTPRATIFSRLVEGRFPKWRDVFPQARNSHRVDFAVGPLYAAIRQASIVANSESRGIDFQFREGSLVLKGVTADVGQSRVEMPIPYGGPEITVTMNHRFVADFLKVLDPEKSIVLDFENDETAALFTTDDGYGYVVMPLARDR
jgi:DNA polymerase III subunit beta